MIHARHAEKLARVWSLDRSQTVGASEVGQCLRKTWFAKNSWDTALVAMDEDAGDRWGARMRGSIYENHFWEPALRAGLPTGAELHFAGAEQRTLVREYLSATSDAVITGLSPNALAHYGVADIESDCIVADCKTADPRTNLDEAKPENVFQVQVQLGLVRELTNYRPVHAVLTYTDASFWDEIKTFVVRFDPEIYAAAHQRATLVMTALRPDDVRPEGVISGGKECAYCPYTRACGQLRAAAVPTPTEAKIDDTLAAEIIRLATTVKTLDAEAEAAEAEARLLKQQIKDALRQAGTRRLARDGLTISWAALRGRPSHDMAAFKEAAMKAGVDIDAFQTVGDPSDRLVITEKRA